MKFAMLILIVFALVAHQKPVAGQEKCPALVVTTAPECAGLDAAACGALAQKTRQEQYAGPALDTARRLYEAACQKGHVPSCVLAAELQLSSDYCKAQELFVRACEMGDYVSCVQAGHMIGNGSPDGQAAPDARRAAALYEQACKGEYGRACVLFADVLEVGAGVPRDKKRATAMRDRAKQLGYLEE